MSLKNDIELANTRVKLARLERRYETLRNDTTEDEHLLNPQTYYWEEPEMHM